MAAFQYSIVAEKRAVNGAPADFKFGIIIVHE